MKLIKKVLKSMATTGLITMVNYWRTKNTDDQFVEPQLMGAVIHKDSTPDQINGEIQSSVGWMGHLAVSAGLNLLYDRVWEKTSARPTLINGLAAGAITGLGVIGLWKMTLDNNPASSVVSRKKLYRQILLGHLVMGAVSTRGRSDGRHKAI